jgi:hypothetical protein
MLDLASNGFTRRNFDVVNDFITRYCAFSATIDSLSCACVAGFNPRNEGFWGVKDNQSYSLFAFYSVTGVFFTDPLCSSVPCRTDAEYFTIDESNNKFGPEVLISPSILFAKKQCPPGLCFVLNEGSTVNASQVQTRQEINISNFDFMCNINNSNTISTISIGFDVLIKSRDRRGDIVGQFNYEPTTGKIQDGSAIINLSFVFPELQTFSPLDAQFTIDVSDGGQDSSFRFSQLSGTFSSVTPQNANFSLPAIVPKLQDNTQICIPPCFNTYFDTQNITVTFTISNTILKKQFPVRILMYPTTPRPPNTSSTQEQINNLPVEFPKVSFSRTTIAVLILCGVLLFYSIIFLLEFAEISSLKRKIIQQFSSPPIE